MVRACVGRRRCRCWLILLATKPVMQAGLGRHTFPCLAAAGCKMRMQAVRCDLFALHAGLNLSHVFTAHR